MHFKHEDIFIYLDPPYFQKGSDLYMNFFKAEDHRQLRDVIKNMRNKIISMGGEFKYNTKLTNNIPKITAGIINTKKDGL